LLWDAITGKEQLLLQKETHEVTSCAISADGRTIVSLSFGGVLLRMWKTILGKKRLFWWVPLGLSFYPPFHACTISANGHLVVACRFDKIYMWKIGLLWRHRTLHGHEKKITSCAISADGHTIVSASDDRTLKVWDTTSGKDRLTLSGHTSQVKGCALSPDGCFIISIASNTFKVWNAVSGICLLTIPVDKTLYGCIFHSSGKHFVVYGEQGVFLFQLVL